MPDPIKLLETNRAFWGLPETVYANASVPIWPAVYTLPEGCRADDDCTYWAAKEREFEGPCQVTRTDYNSTSTY